MNKMNFEPVSMDVLIFAVEDIITSSSVIVFPKDEFI